MSESTFKYIFIKKAFEVNLKVNYFVTIKSFREFEKVAYYTFQIEGDVETETEKFFERFENDAEFDEDLQNIAKWMIEIGDKRGAKPQFFRFEGSAEALPPPAMYLAELEMPSNDLRLYCIRLSEEIVILANGGIKTAQKVQDSPDLQAKFRFVGQIALRITEMIKDKSFRFSGKTIFDLDKLEIEL